MAHYGVRGGGAAGDGSWGRRVGSNAAREFEDYDHTPYGGGYDITQVYGRPFSPSEETCYPITRASSGQLPPSAYSAWRKTAQEPHPYGAPGGSFGKQSHPQPQPAYGAPGGSFGKQSHPQSQPAYGAPGGSFGKQSHPQPQPAYGAPGGSFGKPSHPQPQPAYGASGGSFGKPSYPQAQPAYGFHPQQEVTIDDGHHEFGYGGGAHPKVDYGLRPGAYSTDGYDKRPSGLGLGLTGPGPARREETSHNYGYGQGHQTGMVYPVEGHGPAHRYVDGGGHNWPQDHGPAHGYVDGGGHNWPQDHGPRSEYMEPVSSFGREPSSYGQMEQRQGSHGIHQGQRLDGSKYVDDVAIEEKKHYYQKHTHHR